jgi:hypothetical protein
MYKSVYYNNKNVTTVKILIIKSPI